MTLSRRRRYAASLFVVAGTLPLFAGCTPDVPEPDRAERLKYEAQQQQKAAPSPPGEPTKRPEGPLHILTQRYDPGRSGVTLRETALNPGNVNKQSFGRLFSRDLDGETYAQPLYVSDYEIGGKKRNVVFAATEHNSVYAYDADDPAASEPLWKTNLGRSVHPDEIGRAPYGIYRDYQTEIGITGTPVIDLAANRLYVSAFTTDGKGAFRHSLHALDLRTGKVVLGPTEIRATVPGTGIGSQHGKLSFNPKTSNQRGALLLDKGVIYVAFGSHADIQPYHGWVMAYDAKTLKQLSAWPTTPSGEGGGVWMAGVGPSTDGTGAVYIAVGDGTFTADKGGQDYGDSFVKLRLTGGKLQAEDFFSPFNQAYLNERDKDLGSTGAILPAGKDFLIAGSKAGRMYQMRREGMGKHNPQSDDQILSWADATTGNIYGSPILWEDPKNGPTVFVWGGYDYLRAYRMTPDGKLPKEPTAKGPVKAPNGKPGGILAVSSDADAENTGIVWAYLPVKGNANRVTVPGVLRAFDAQDVTREHWNSEEVPERDSVGNFGKFCVPTVANGKVYLGTFSNKLHVYGLLPQTAPAPVAQTK